MSGPDSAPAPCNMRIGIVTPAPPRSRYGNRVTALRWARILRSFGQRVNIIQEYRGEAVDLLIVLHARRSHGSLKLFNEKHPNKPTVVALTGTDLYRDFRKSRSVRESLELATRIVALQPAAIDELDAHLQRKVRVIYQSTQRETCRQDSESTLSKFFNICVIGHLREVKDPFRAAMAARSLPPSSRIRVIQVGGAMSDQMAARARREMRSNGRYRWVGELPRGRTRRIICQSRLSVIASKIEGGANVLSEAIMSDTPVIASWIPGNVGILGEDYPGYFKAGDTSELRALLIKAETDSVFLQCLEQHCRKLIPLFLPEREQAAWASLLRELFKEPEPEVLRPRVLR